MSLGRARRALGVLVCLALGAASVAAAKDFEPGDLRICGPTRCTPLMDAPTLKSLAEFYYGPTSPPVARAPRLGVQAYELRFEGNGYATGIVAGANLDRFLSYGVNLGHFRRGTWYRLPPATAGQLKCRAASLKPYRLTRSALLKSR
jgi:hypothetical protein